jgi:hypothetical protein
LPHLAALALQYLQTPGDEDTKRHPTTIKNKPYRRKQIVILRTADEDEEGAFSP